MSKQQTPKGTASGRQQDHENRSSQSRLFATLGITNVAAQHTISNLLQQVYDEESGDLRSSIRRNRVRQEIRDRMGRMPAAIQNHSESRDNVVDMLYNLLKLLRAQWNKEPATKSTQQPPVQSQNGEPHMFDHSGPSVVPDADVQIVTHNNPGQPISIRLSDLLPDTSDPRNRSEDGDWLNASAIRLVAFRQNLVNDGYMVDGAALWFSPHALDTIDSAQLGTPQDGETRLNSMNLASTVRRAIATYYPSHRQPSPDNQDGTPRSPLARPNFTIIIRPRRTTGGALVPQQPELIRPGGARQNSIATGPSAPRAPATQVQDASVRPTNGETPGPQRDAQQQPLQDLVADEPQTLQAPPTTTPAPQRQHRVAAVEDEPFDYTVPQSAIDALGALGPDSGWFKYEGLSIVPRRNPLPGAIRSTTQPTENTGERRRRALDDDASTRPARRCRLSNEATAQRDPSGETAGIRMTFDVSALPATEGLEETQRLGRALGLPPQPSVAQSLPRPLASATLRRQSGSRKILRRARNRPRSSSSGESQAETRQQPSIVPDSIPPVAEVISRLEPDEGTKLYQQVGEPWLGINGNRVPPQVQEAIGSRRVTAEIDQATQLLALSGGPEEPSPPFSAPFLLATNPIPTEPAQVPRASDDSITANRESRRRFSEYQRRPAESSSSGSQVSPRKKRRFSIGSSSLTPSPPKKARRGTNRALTEQDLAMWEALKRLSNQTSQSPRRQSARRSGHRTLSPKFKQSKESRSSCPVA